MKTLAVWALALVALCGTALAQDAAPAAVKVEVKATSGEAPVKVEVKAADPAPAAPAAADAPAAATVDKSFKFDDDKGLEGWTVSGDATIDKTKNHGEGAGGAIKVGPKSKLVLKVGEADAAGTVEFWVYDDGAKPEDPAAPRSGPVWGITNAKGKHSAIGMVYAKYLKGAESCALCESADGKNFHRLVQYLGAPRAANAWTKWTMTFDNDKGLVILCNDKPVKSKYSQDKVTVAGFVSVVIVGDQGKGNEQTIWVDDVTVKTTGAAKAKPEAPKADAPKADAPKTDAPKADAPKVDAPKADAAK